MSSPLPADLRLWLATWNALPRPPLVLPTYPTPYTRADADAGRPVPF
jgi:hypothetical protein